MNVAKKTFCRNCTSMCGLDVEVEGTRITKVSGDSDHAITKGYHCIKARLSVDLGNGDTGRIAGSQKRQPDGTFAPIDNEQAMDEIATKVEALVARHGPRSIGLFNGTGSYFDTLSYPIMKAFLGELETPNLFSTMTIDQSAYWVSALRLGMMASGQDVIADFETLMIIGKNPVVSHQLTGMHRPGRSLSGMKKAGRDIILVDPRASETARFATEHVALKPGTDVALFAGLIREILVNEWYDREACDRFAVSLPELRAAVEPYTLDEVERRTDVPREQIARVARLMANTKSYASTGTGICFGPHSNLAVHLVHVMNFLCGCFRRAGDPVKTQNLLNPTAFVETAVSPTRAWEKGVKLLTSDTGQMFGEFPSGALCDEILIDHPERIRALFVVSGNPLTSLGQPEKTLEAFSNLELLITLNPLMTATTRMAHYAISPTLQYERHDLTTFPGLPQPFAQYTAPVVAPPPGSIDFGVFFWGLAKRLGLKLKFKKLILGDDYKCVPGGWEMDMETIPANEKLARWWCEDSLVDFETLKANPSGIVIDLEGAVVSAAEDDGSRIALCPDDIAVELGKVLEDTDNTAFPYRLTSRRLLECMNGLFRDHGTTRRRYATNFAYMHPDDMAREELVDGSSVTISNRYDDAITAPVKADKSLRTGMISMAHQWGDPRTSSKGANTSDALTAKLVSMRIEDVDPINRMPLQTSIEVQLARAN